MTINVGVEAKNWLVFGKICKAPASPLEHCSRDQRTQLNCIKSIRFMTRMTKGLLALSILGIGLGIVFVTGLINVERQVAFYVTLPFGAVFLGLFLISKMLEHEPTSSTTGAPRPTH